MTSKGTSNSNSNSNGKGNSGFLPPSAPLRFDSSGNLIVEDVFNNRVLIFAPPFISDMNATAVLGQPNLTTIFPNQFDNVPVGANTLRTPTDGLVF